MQPANTDAFSTTRTNAFKPAALTRLGAFIAAVAAGGVSALAQPPATDLGDFSHAASTLHQPTVISSPTTPIEWFRIRLPRIAAPHRFLDITTSGPFPVDTEIALFAADGRLIATDDEDGAALYSALTFGITDTAAPTRVPPPAASGQQPGVANNGRDGTLSGDPATGTAADYYIAFTQFDAVFADGFSVTRPNGPPTANILALLTVRMHTPGGGTAPTLSGGDLETVSGVFFAFATASAGTSAVSVDASAANGPSARDLVPGADGTSWSSFAILLNPVPAPGIYPLLYRASNPIGDVTVDEVALSVFPRGRSCNLSFQQIVQDTPGTNIYTYTTAFANVDGPWTSACFTSPPSGNDVWFRFRPTQSGAVTLSTCNADTGATGNQPDTLLGVRGFCNDAGFSVCGDDVGGCGLGTRLTDIPVTARQDYNIAVRAWSGDITNGRLAVTFTPGGPTCDSIDFNGDGLFPDNQDLEDFFSVFGGGPCSTGPLCGDLDFNNDELFPDNADLESYLRVFGGGDC